MNVKKWEILSSEYVLKERWMTVRADKCRTDKGIIVQPYFVQESVDWAQALAITPHQQVILIRQYRHAVAEVVYELPGGCVDLGESPDKAVVRELLEETGYAGNELKVLPTLFPNPARFNNRMHSYVVLNAEKVSEPKPEPAENIEIILASIPELLELLWNGKMSNALHTFNIVQGLITAGLLELKIK